MGGRFGKYGDLKRRKALQCGRKEMARLAQVCRLHEPFELRLRRFAFFVHAHRNATFYLVPEPAAAIKALHQALLDKVPDCSDVALFTGGLASHLSLGQMRSQDIEAWL